MNSWIVKIYQFYAELFKSSQQKMNLKYKFHSIRMKTQTPVEVNVQCERLH